MAREFPQASTDALRISLTQRDTITHRVSGNRTHAPSQIIDAVTIAAMRTGVRRLTALSDPRITLIHITTASRPARPEATRPQHPYCALGKGFDTEQSALSCMMEAISSFGAEPVDPTMRSALVSEVNDSQPHAELALLTRRLRAHRLLENETVLWSPALDLVRGSEVLIPAECIYYPFDCQAYNCRRVFPTHTSGLSAGWTYLEALTTSLYELIERWYVSAIEKGEAILDCLFESEIEHRDYATLTQSLWPAYQLQIHTARLPHVNNLPMVIAVLAGEDEGYSGFGCASTFDQAADRAITEAVQCLLATGRGKPEPPIPSDYDPGFRQYRNMRIRDYSTRAPNTSFNDLGTEMRFLLDWLREAGFVNIFAANLTRHGIDIPTVKVVVPGLPTRYHLLGTA